ncbi:NUMOD3 domain-containing DNA-binding protein [Shewanella xiamenensis]|uniref:NUMOD3 domain-containing DNA-binding protein n=1 Tax=Shewanella xiamenensis TaxID=332186 RepID=UPI0021C11A91|nr:NUMOD3 domain-containing DNA-binding protein [Shewanella xiamenensis]MCT8876664.1 hypothetical protein [Shewanella xiamenensis]
MYTYNHWISNTEKTTTAKAFTYTIFFPETNHRYIGYKTISDRSKWLTYKSSSKYVKELLSEGHIAIYSIVNWFDNAEDARAEEVLLMTIHQVTKRPEFLNRSISGVKFSTAGKTLSAEHRAKVSAAGKGRKHTDEARANMSAAQKGLTKPPLTSEHRAKISAANKNRTISDETRAKLSAANKGHYVSSETRAKLSAAKQNVSAETRAKIGASSKGRIKSAETCAKLSAASHKGLYVTPLGTFKTRRDAAIVYNCDTTTIGYRCNSTSPKFKDWYFQPK